MKTVVCQSETRFAEVLAVLVNLNGERPPVTDDCIARMVSIAAGGEQVLQLVVVGRLGDHLTRRYPIENGCPLDVDGLFEWWRRMCVYHPEGELSVQASKYIERMIADVLTKHLEGIGSAVADEVWFEAFNTNLSDEHVVDIKHDVEDTGDANELEVLCARLLTPAEREHLLPQVADDWVTAINRSLFSDENSDAGEETQPWCRSTKSLSTRRLSPKWRVGFLAGGIVTTTILLGLLLGMPKGFQDRSMHYDGTTEVIPPHTSSASSITTLYDTTSKSSMHYDMAFTSSRNYDAVSSRLDTITFESTGLQKHDTKPAGLSQLDLSSLLTFQDDKICQRAYAATQESMRLMNTTSWMEPCDGNGGQLVCAWEDQKHLVPFCYSFGLPTKFDFTAVREAVILYRAPDVCGIHCNTVDSARRLMNQRLATELDTRNKNYESKEDINDPYELQNIGKQVKEKLIFNKKCSPTCYRNRCRELAKTNCNCPMALLQCSNGGAKITSLLFFRTNTTELSERASAIWQPLYKDLRCDVRCYDPAPSDDGTERNPPNAA